MTTNELQDVAGDSGQLRFRALFEHTLNAVILIDDSQCCIDANPAACTMLAFTREELLTMRLGDVIVAAPGQIDARVAQLLGHRRERGLVRLRRKDGALLIAEFSAVASMLPGVHLYVLQDVTQRHAVERELRERTARYDLIVEGVRDGIWDWDIPRKRVFLSPQWKRLRGYEDYEFGHNYRDWSEGVHPDDAQRVHDALQAHVKGTSASFDEEYRVRCKDGSWKWVHDRGVAQRDASGRATRMAGAETDITERRRAEAERLDAARRLHDMSSHLDTAMSVAGLGVSRFDLRSERTFLDDNMRALLGLSPYAEGLSMQALKQLIHLDDTAAFVAGRDECLRGGQSALMESRMRHANGSWRHLMGRSVLVRDAGGQPASITMLTLDVTEQRQAEAALRAKELAEQANRAKTQFLSRMSHELRTPLNAVLGFSELLLHDERAPLAAHQLEQLRHVRGAGQHLLRLINDLLDISRIEIDALQLHLQITDAKAVFQQTLTDLSPLAAQGEVTTQLFCAESLSTQITTDMTRLRQIAYNLVSNAIKYNRRGGEVTVTIAAAPSGLLLTVADTGIGMNPEQLGKLFQPFDRLGREQSTVAGVGIGLAITKELVKRLGGRLEVISVLGVGSSFTVEMPLSVAQPTS